MADDIISLGVKVTGGDDILKVSNSINTLDRNVKTLSKTYDRGNLSVGAYYTGLKSQIDALVKMGVAQKKAEKYVHSLAAATIDAADASKDAAAASKAEAVAVKAYAQARREATEANQRYNAETKRHIADQAKVSAALESNYLAQQKSNKAARDSAKVFMEDAAAKEANTAQVHRYRMASDAVYAAEQKLLQLKKTLRTEVANDNMTMREAAAVQMQYKQSLTGTGNAMVQSRNRMSSMGVVTQQVGYQVGDFAVQVQSGQSALVAFSQQATQLVGVLPLMSKQLGISAGKLIAISAGLGIGIPILTAIGAAFLRTRSAAEDGSKGIKTYADAAKDAHKEIREARLETEALNKGFRDSGELTLQQGLDKARKDLEDAVKARDALLVPKDTKDIVRPEGYGNMLGGSRRKIQGTQIQTSAEVASRAIANKMAAEAVELAEEEVSAREKLIRLLLEQRATEEALTRGMEDRKSMLESEKALLEERDRVVKGIIKDRDTETKSLKDQIDLNKLILQYGKESSEVKALQAEQARNNYKAEKEAEGILGNNLKIIMASYDENVKITDEMYNLVDAATDLGTRLGMAFSDAINLIRQAKAEAMVGLDAFGGSGEFKYSTPTVFNKPKKTGGRSSGGGGGGGGKSPAEELSEYLSKLQQQAELERQLVGLFDEKRSTEEEVIKARQKYGEVFGASQEAELRGTLAQIAADKERQDALEESNSQMQSVADTMQSSMSDAFMSMVEGTKSFKDSMKDMARAVIKQLFDILVVQRLVGSFDNATGKGSGLVGSIMKGIGGFLGGAKTQANGGAWSGGSQIKAYANGGVVNSPTMFGHSGGLGVMGEAGPEAIMPLKRGANGKLGVQMEGSSGGDVVINQSFNFQANGDDSVKKLIAQAAPQIASMTQKQIMDSRRRGGAMKTAFG